MLEQRTPFVQGYEKHSRRKKKFRGKMTLKKLDKKINSLAKQVNEDAEMKAQDTIEYAINAAGIGLTGPDLMNNVGFFRLIEYPDLGNEPFQRSGNEIAVKGIKVMLSVSAQTSSFFRIVIVRDSQPRAALPGWTQVFRDAEELLPTNLQSGRNREFIQRYTVLYDKFFAANTDTLNQIDKIYIPQNITARISGNGDDVNNIESNAYYIGYACSVTTDQPEIAWQARVRYIDS